VVRDVFLSLGTHLAGMPIGPKDSRAVGKQKMLNYVMRVGTKAAENNLQRLIAARP